MIKIRCFTLTMMIVSASAAYTMEPTKRSEPTWKPMSTPTGNNVRQADPHSPVRRNRGQRPALNQANLDRVRRRLDF